MKLPIKQLLLALGLATTVYALVLMLTDGSSLAKLQQRLFSSTGLLCAILCLLSYVLRGLRWRNWMRHYERRLDLLAGLRIYLAGYTFTPTPGNIGEAARGLLLTRQALSPLQSLSIFGAERLADLASLLLLTLPGLWWFFSHHTQPGWLSALALATGLAIALLVMVGFRFGKQLLSRYQWISQAWQCLRHKPWQWLALTLGAWTLQGVVVWLLCIDNMLNISLSQATGFYAIAMVGGAASMLPAGLGGMEALMTGLFMAAGAELNNAVAITVLVRLLTLWLAVAVGAMALLYSAAIRKDLRLS